MRANTFTKCSSTTSAPLCSRTSRQIVTVENVSETADDSSRMAEPEVAKSIISNTYDARDLICWRSAKLVPDLE